MDYPSQNELENNEASRVKMAEDKLKDWSDLHEKMSTDYIAILSGLYKERREMLKYIGTVAAGAAALAPQMLDKVHQAAYFYSGVGLLCLVVVITVTYVLSSLENEAGNFSKDLRSKNNRIDKVRKPWKDFLEGGDYSVKALAKAVSEEIKEANEFAGEIKKEEKSGFLRMDYTGEFIILFFVGGISLLVLSLTSVYSSWCQILWLAVGVFIVINIISTFPTEIFRFLGFPIDVLKAAIRFLTKRK